MAKDIDLDDGLTDEERAALSSDDDLADSGDDTNEKAAQSADEADPDEQAEQEAAAAAEAEAAKQAAEAAAADAKPGEAEQPAAKAEPTSQQQAPILVAQAPEDAEARLTEISAKKDELLEKFDNGDVTAREYQKELDALNKQERTIEADLFEARMAQKLETQRLQNEWNATCAAFVDANPVYKDNQRLYRALDAEVRELASKPETSNWSGQKFLEEAHKALAKDFNLPTAGKSAPPPVAPRRDLPPNLAKVPSAEVEDTSGGRYAVLDRMAASDPLGYEEALAKMSDAERNAYLSA